MRQNTLLKKKVYFGMFLYCHTMKSTHHVTHLNAHTNSHTPLGKHLMKDQWKVIESRAFPYACESSCSSVLEDLFKQTDRQSSIE